MTDPVVASQPNVTLRQLLLLDAVARNGGITHAANEFGLSQPAATQSIAALQERTGLVLIERRGRQSALTALGQSLHDRLAPILTRLENGLADIGVDSPRQTKWELGMAQISLMAAIRAAGTLEGALASSRESRRTALRTIRACEALVGSRLLEPAAGQSQLTGAGILLADRLGSIPREISAILRDLTRPRGSGMSPFILGVTPDPGTAGLDAVILGHLQTYGDSQIAIVEGTRDNLVTRLVVGEIDLLICHLPSERRTDCVWQVLGRSTFSVVAGKDHPLARRTEVPLQDLMGFSWLMGLPGTERRKASDILFAGREQPRCRLVTAAAPLMTKVLGVSDALALMTDRELEPRSHLLTVIDHDTPQVAVTLGWACRADWSPDEAAQDFIARLNGHFAAEQS